MIATPFSLIFVCHMAAHVFHLFVLGLRCLPDWRISQIVVGCWCQISWHARLIARLSHFPDCQIAEFARLFCKCQIGVFARLPDWAGCQIEAHLGGSVSSILKLWISRLVGLPDWFGTCFSEFARLARLSCLPDCQIDARLNCCQIARLGLLD